MLNRPELAPLHEQIVPLELNVQHEIRISSPGVSSQHTPSIGTQRRSLTADVNPKFMEYSLFATLTSAEHIMGSVMILFEKMTTPTFRCLYTGDFRLSINQVRAITCLKDQSRGEGQCVKDFDAVYFDSTWCTPRHLWSIPQREEVLEELEPIVKRHLEARVDNIVCLYTMYNVGYENLLKWLAKVSQSPVHVNEERMRLYRGFTGMEDVLTIRPDCRIHFCQRGPFQSYKGCEQVCGRYKTTVLRLKASYMWFIREHRVNSEMSTCVRNLRWPNEYNVCWSTHASLEEVNALLEYLNPRRACPNVTDKKTSELEILDTLRRHAKEVKLWHPKHALDPFNPPQPRIYAVVPKISPRKELASTKTSSSSDEDSPDDSLIERLKKRGGLGGTQDETAVLVVCRFGEEVRIPRKALQESMLTEYARRLGESQWRSDGMALKSGQLFYAVQSVASMLRGQTVELTEENVGDVYAAARELQVGTLLTQLEDYLVDHIDKLSRAHLEKLDAALFERILLRKMARNKLSRSPRAVLSKNKEEGAVDTWRWARVLFRWWRVDLGKRKDDFTRLAEQLSYNADAHSSESCSSEQDNETLSRVEIPRKSSNALADKSAPKTQSARVVTVAGQLWSADLECEVCILLKLCEAPLLRDVALKDSMVTIALCDASRITTAATASTVASITHDGVLRICRDQSEVVEMPEKVRGILHYKCWNILWLENDSFRISGGSDALEPCPEKLLEELNLADLPTPPHREWLGRMCSSSGGCVLLYYPCWGLFLRRPGEALWKLLSEELFVEYLSPIPSCPNAFYILAWKGYSLQAYRTDGCSHRGILLQTFSRRNRAQLG
ncbi:protein artemis-like [Tropilaelaps mercedesae]|uniref:Protein artemis-like n=1 Tax=Tropilaelaps mercedesae TaxID=418985 RepID=A0A1V9X924_9ACAR|nr:protein artemis-like [Tropilaelaps mercedesae]